MAAAVQYYPQQSSTVTMLQAPRPNSATSNFQNASHVSSHQHLPRSSQTPRNLYNTTSVGLGAGSYRGHTTLSPSVAPYAFTSTPGLMDGANPLRQNPPTPHLRQENRTSSAPVIPPSQQKQNGENFAHNKPRYPAPAPASSTPSSTSSDPPARGVHVISKDDTSIPSTQRAVDLNTRPASMIGLNGAYSNTAGLSINPPPKPSPDRYRRVNRRNEPTNSDTNIHQVNPQGGSALPSGSGMATVGHLYNHPSHANSSPSLQSHQGFGSSSTSQPSRQNPAFVNGGYPQAKPASVDDMQAYRQPTTEQAKRYRRRSISSLDAAEVKGSVVEIQGPTGAQQLGAGTSAPSGWQDSKGRSSPQGAVRPTSSHGRNGSAESDSSARSRSRPSSVKREPGTLQASANSSYQVTPISKHEAKLVNIPPRGSSEANKRLTSPSPLSRPVAMGSESPSSKQSLSASQRLVNAEPHSPKPLAAHQGAPESSAAQQLAALNEKEGKKGVKSRLRRAFSFGSAAELRRASAENNLNNTQSVERARLRKERYQDEREQEQAAIAQKQEAGGIGEGIYSGQGHFFTGSTDNLSISSTASSASVMIRKMGKGMKKSSRSLVGLFRPKSVVGVPAAENAVPEPSLGQVSMVTVEAEREKVNVNADPHDQAGGGTGFPKLERNSLDAAAATAATTSASEPRPALIERGSDENPRGRRSIVGGETERAEVLAAVKKGILKRRGTDSGNSSPVTRPLDVRATEFVLPNIPQISDTPVSSAPSTPRDEQPPRSGHRRTDSVTIEGEDYFMSTSKFSVGDSKSAPATPQGVTRNINFSPRIQFHDTWTSMEYDRRGEIATCNRLTPMLAQQIKEELNSFKMEMEVHEQSKVYTHFF